LGYSQVNEQRRYGASCGDFARLSVDLNVHP
jgi:hypothetical protein